MLLSRRSLLAGAGMALLAPRNAFAQAVTDGAGRAVAIPAKVTRVFPAGPPAAILLYTLAPDLLIGWPRAHRAEECIYMLPDVCMRPAVGRITGRGNTANLETVLALKPDLILDIGSVNDTYILFRSPTGCSSRPAFPMRCSTAVSTGRPMPTPCWVG